MDARNPIAIWNRARDVWESPNSIDLFSELLDVYSETLPNSGSMRSGVLYERPMLEPRMGGSGSSLLPTPRAADGNGGVFPLVRPENMDNLETRVVRLLPTPAAYDSDRGGSQDPVKRRAGGHQPSIADVVEHL